MAERQREVTLRFLTEPSDVNFGGKVHGGMVMKWIDQAGYAAAVAWAGTYCVTVAVEGIQFVQPILIGDMVRVQARLAYTGSSSMHFTVDVIAHDLRTGVERLATSCVIVFVALDAPNGRPAPVSLWEPQAECEQCDRDYVLKLAELSRVMQRMIHDHRTTILDASR